MNTKLTYFLPLTLALTAFTAIPAHAGLAECGNIDVKADAICKVETSGGCTAACTPLSVDASCAADLFVSCQGMCNATVDATCTASCDVTSCEASCTATPAQFDCSANCTAKAEGMCAASCAADADKAKCTAACKATASGECDASCKVVPPTADCKAKCNASCQGECKAKANGSCQISCQRSGSVMCEAMVKGKCEAECTKPEGAIFCNGSYVDTDGNAQKCIDALKAKLAVSVDVSARGTAECSGGSCNAEGEASASCTASPARGEKVSSGILALLGLALGGAMVRRNKRLG